MSREPVQKGSRGAGGLLGPLFLGLLTFSVIFIILELFSLKVMYYLHNQDIKNKDLILLPKEKKKCPSAYVVCEEEGVRVEGKEKRKARGSQKPLRGAGRSPGEETRPRE